VSAYLVVFLAAAGTTFVATPFVRRFVIGVGAIDHPSDRKVHPVDTPTMGGLAMYLGLVVALVASRFLPFFDDLNAASPEPLAALVTCTLMVGLGVVDDMKGMRAVTKLVSQIFIAGVLVLLGVQLAYFVLPISGEGNQIVVLDSNTAVVLTVHWVIAVANAVNLVDGLDGLAAGIITIASSGFFFYMVRSESLFGDASQAALLSAITAGICLGFLPWNFHPAKIFMGDTGSMLLGMLLALATISGVGRNPIAPSKEDLTAVLTAILAPLVILFIPFLDVLLAVIRRTRRGQGIGHPDKEHIHHRLMDIGHGHRKAVLLMYLWTALVVAAGLAVGLLDGWAVIASVVVGSLVLFLVTLLPRLMERRANGAAHTPATPPG
jgi:UDP-GlcNAc:undecaprenyl-phosphate GlcNAc-1-phosphate transferase